jgi:two-component system, OmpR family, response regulator
MKTKENILIIENEQRFRADVDVMFRRKHFNVFSTYNIPLAETLIAANDYSYIIIGSTPSLEDIISVAKVANKKDDKIRIILLVSDSFDDKFLKDEGIKNYTCFKKPIDLSVLSTLSKTKEKALSTPQRQTHIIKFGKYSFNFMKRLLVFRDIENDDKVEMLLTRKESLLLKVLLDNINCTISREDILNNIWLSDAYSNSRSMDVYITKLRKYLKSDPSISIKNVHGVGFRLETDM